MPLLQLCMHPGCTTWTIGGLCVQHEPVQEPRVFPRGRPFPPVTRRPAVANAIERENVAAITLETVTAVAPGLAP